MNFLSVRVWVPLRRVCWLTVVCLLGAIARADTVDEAVATLMAKRKLTGLSLAVIENGAIVKAKGYGFIDRERSAPVTPDTLFQAGSVSKPVAALGALRLVEKGKLTLDANVNDALVSWKIPDNSFTTEEKVTLRRLLSHSAGLTVHGFPGYAVDAAQPTLVQILNGEKPANTPAIRVDVVPGTRWRYSGGGFTVMQQLMIDVTGKSFPDFMRVEVLEPLGMRASTFEQPLSATHAAQTASGYFAPQRAVPGRWHVYPEMAAAGLWTTPSDLARFAIALQEGLADRSTPLISAKLMKEMLTRQKNNFGLGIALSGKDDNERFEHGGRDAGFDAQLTAYREKRHGAVVMINANDNAGTLGKVIEAIAVAYAWPEFPRTTPPQPIEDKEPEVANLLKEIFAKAKQGKLDRELYTPQLANAIANAFTSEEGAQAELNSYGELKAVALVGRNNQGDVRQYRYRFTYEKETVIVRCAINADGKLSGLSFQPE